MPKRKREEQVDQYFDNMWLLVSCDPKVANLAKLLTSMAYQEAKFDNIRVVARRAHPRTSKAQQVLVIADLKNASRLNLYNVRSDGAKTSKAFKDMFRQMVASLGDQASLIFGIKLADNLAHEAFVEDATKKNKSKKESTPNIKTNQKLWLVFSFEVGRVLSKHEYYTVKSNLTSNLDGVAKFLVDSIDGQECATFADLKLLSVRWSRSTRPNRFKLFGASQSKVSYFNVLALATIKNIVSQDALQDTSLSNLGRKVLQNQDPQGAMRFTAECITHAAMSRDGWCFDYAYHDSDKPRQENVNQTFDDKFDEQGCVSILDIHVV